MHLATLPLLWVLSLVELGCTAVAMTASVTVQATPTIKNRGVFAIDPTKPGQIGVNPVASDLGDAASYIGDIVGTDTKYITILDSDTTTKASYNIFRFIHCHGY